MEAIMDLSVSFEEYLAAHNGYNLTQDTVNNEPDMANMTIEAKAEYARDRRYYAARGSEVCLADIFDAMEAQQEEYAETLNDDRYDSEEIA